MKYKLYMMDSSTTNKCENKQSVELVHPVPQRAHTRIPLMHTREHTSFTSSTSIPRPTTK